MKHPIHLPEGPTEDVFPAAVEAIQPNKTIAQFYTPDPRLRWGVTNINIHTPLK